jgi:hypothetical protein
LRLCGVVSCLTAISLFIACGGGSGSGGGTGGGGTGGTSPPAYPGNRTALIRTGDTPSSAVYDSLHNLVFASEPDLGLVDAISISNAKIVARIPVPGVEAVGLSADNTTILASTNLQQVAWIDTALMQVTKWQMLPQVNDPVSGLQFWTPFNPYCILPNFANGIDFPAYTQNPYLLANGKVLFEALEGGFSPVVMEWDPVANTAVLRRDLPAGGFVLANTTGTEVLFASGPTFYDSATDSVRSSSAIRPALLAAGNPAGTQFALFEGPGLVFIDNQFNIVGQVSLTVTGPLAQQPTGLVYSPDGTRLYMAAPGAVPIITTIDTTNFSIVGTAPGYSNVTPDSASATESPLTADGTGIVIGSGLGGIVFDDSTDLYTFTQNDETTAGFSTPSEGPVQGGTVVTVSTGIPTVTPDVWFGSQLATAENASGVPQVEATTPPAGAAGVVDVKIIEPTGVMVMVPQGFTYGSVSLLTAPLAAAPTGGVTADIYGFGFSAESGATTQQVTIGTGSAKVLAATQLLGIPVQDLTISIPPGSPGPADIVVKSATGTATYPNGFRYLSSLTDYSSTDTFLAVLYDSARQQLYLNAGDHLDVFSLVSNSFGTPITPPSLGGTRQLQGMALTPGGSQLIVGNYSDDSVAIIDPDSPTTAKAVQIAPPADPGFVQVAPLAVATTSKGTAFVDTGTTSGSTGGGGAIYELNLSNLQVTLRNDIPGFVQVSGEPMSQTGDGTEVFLAVPDNSGGNIMAWFAATDSWQLHNVGGEFELFYDDVAAASDGNVFAVNNAPVSEFSFPMFVNSQLSQISQLGIESLFAAVNQPGMALHNSGALLYSSTDLGVDIIDVAHGALAERILLNEQDAFLSGSLAIDGTGQRVFVLTNAGLTIIELDAVPLSIGSLTPSSGTSGTMIQVRGSGFQSGTSAGFNGTSVSTKFLDGDTLQITVPNMGAGPVAVTLSNPDGTSYELDGAFSVQ